MEAKHTPGPWYADKIQDRGAYNVFPSGATLALLTVAGPVHDGAHPYALAAEANARLIAAAPELLGALSHLFDCLPVGDKGARMFPTSPLHAADLNAALDRARAAIAVAEAA